MCACVCVPTLRLLITSGMIWTPYDWLNKLWSFYIAAVVIFSSGSGLRIQACHRNQPNKSKLELYKPLLSLQQSFLTTIHKQQDGVLQL